MDETAIPAKKTLQRRPNRGEIIKAKELIDVLSPAGLSIQARRTYNLLLEAAHTNLEDPTREHVISLQELRGSDESNARLKRILDQLQTTVITVRYEPEGGTPISDRVQLLGGTTIEHRRDGQFHYRFDPKMIKVLRESRVYAQLKKSVIWAFASRYAMALYEVVERRRNQKHVMSEVLTIDELRNMLDVEEGRYKTFGSLNQTCIKPAIDEVNHLCDFRVEIEPIRSSRKITHVRLSWSMKAAEDIAEARLERKRSKNGRRDRRTQNIEYIEEHRARLTNSLPPAGAGQGSLSLDDDKVLF